MFSFSHNFQTHITESISINCFVYIYMFSLISPKEICDLKWASVLRLWQHICASAWTDKTMEIMTVITGIIFSFSSVLCFSFTSSVRVLRPGSAAQRWWRHLRPGTADCWEIYRGMTEDQTNEVKQTMAWFTMKMMELCYGCESFVASL